MTEKMNTVRQKVHDYLMSDECRIREYQRLLESQSDEELFPDDHLRELRDRKILDLLERTEEQWYEMDNDELFGETEWEQMRQEQIESLVEQFEEQLEEAKVSHG